MGLDGVMWNYMDLYEMWDYMELYGFLRNYMELFWDYKKSKQILDDMNVNGI